MYFCRCYNRDCQYRRNRPSVCQTVEIIPKQEDSVLLKTASAGGVTLSGIAGAEKEYDLIFLDFDSSKRKDASVVLTFSCNVILLRAKVDIRIQLVRSGADPPVPVDSPAVYRRVLEFSGSDTIFFTIHDPVPVRGGVRGYLIKMYVMGGVPDSSMAVVTNPVLTAMML